MTAKEGIDWKTNAGACVSFQLENDLSFLYLVRTRLPTCPHVPLPTMKTAETLLAKPKRADAIVKLPDRWLQL